MSKILFTIGHSTHPINQFIHLLKQQAITAICDIRSHPYSRYNPQFNKKDLQKSLEQHGITYIFLGKELGARSENPACYINGKVQYQLLINEPSFQQGLVQLKAHLENHILALMCAEKDPITCHRMILVCREIRSSVKNINHILADGSLEKNEETENRLLKFHKIVPDLLKDKEACILKAYSKQEQAIAYFNKNMHK